MGNRQSHFISTEHMDPWRMPNAVFSKTSGNVIPEDHGLQARKASLIYNYKPCHENHKSYISIKLYYYNVNDSLFPLSGLPTLYLLFLLPYLAAQIITCFISYTYSATYINGL